MAANKKVKVSVVLPARNEEKLIKDCLLDISKFLKTNRYTYEILVVVNGSNDKTSEITTNLIEKKDKNIKILNSKPGYGFALKKGMQSAKGKYIVIFNVDFYDLDLIKLAEIDLFGRDLVMGSKMAHWSEDNRSVSRRLYSFGYNLFLKLLFGFRGSDTHGIKILRKEVVDKILKKCKTTSGIMDTEFVIRIQRAGYKISDFPVTIVEKRNSRFDNRLFSTGFDLYNLYRALK